VTKRRTAKTGWLFAANRERGPWPLKTLGLLIHGALNLLIKRDWGDGTRLLPRTGGVLILANHVSSFDPPVLGEFVAYQGRWPHFLAKASLFQVPVLGWLLRKAEQVPVYRGTAHSADALDAAVAHLKAGRVVVMYPEGTVTQDPNLWPMACKTGAARLAITTGCPVIPIGQYGANRVLLDGGGPHRVGRKGWGGPGNGWDIFPRKWTEFRTGDPIDMSEFGTDPTDREAVRAATARIVAVLTELVEECRGEKAPELLWNEREQAFVSRDRAVW
jgi:1-acyl-sn-glycerol-3-phosphate acyltransferase